MANSYDRGDTVRLIATFVSSVNDVIEPASVYVLVRNALGSIGTYGYGGPNGTAAEVAGVATVTRVASGAYYMDIVPSCDPPDGLWSYRFDAGGGVTAAAGEESFYVRPTHFL